MNSYDRITFADKKNKIWDLDALNFSFLVNVTDYVYIALNLGNGTEYNGLLINKDFNNRGFLDVGINRTGYFRFRVDGTLFHPSYISEKLNIGTIDANNLCDFLNQYVYGNKDNKFGRYEYSYMN